MSDNDRLEGKAKELGGKVQQGVGDLTGDEQTYAEGKSNETKGKAQNLWGKVKDTAKDAADFAKDKAHDVTHHDGDNTTTTDRTV